MSDFHIEWIDRMREPQCAPDPQYPNGVELRLNPNGEKGCKVVLPYPAPRCGIFYVECKICGSNAMITTAGRSDDPRLVEIPCK